MLSVRRKTSAVSRNYHPARRSHRAPRRVHWRARVLCRARAAADGSRSSRTSSSFSVSRSTTSRPRKIISDIFRSRFRRRRARHRLDGALRVGANSRARNSRSDRIDLAERKSRRAACCDPQTDLVGDLDRIGRAVRRGGSDHQVTGGAFGSMIAQLFRLTAAERKTLLVAGAAAGMSATFAALLSPRRFSPSSWLLFEWKPRSPIPVALASITALARASSPSRRRSPSFPVPVYTRRSRIHPPSVRVCFAEFSRAHSPRCSRSASTRSKRSFQKLSDSLDVVAWRSAASSSASVD